MQECVECGSGLLSSIRHWRPLRKSELDVLLCHDCGVMFSPDGKVKPKGWVLPNLYETKSKSPGQTTIFGGMEDPRALVNPVPKMVEAPNGLKVVVYKVPAGSPPEYRKEVASMASEFQQVRSAARPHWWRYRRIKSKGKSKLG